MKIFIVVVICSLVLSIASLKIDNSYNIENNQNDFFNYLVNLIEHKSQYKLKAFPYVKKNIFKDYWKNNSFNNPQATPFAVKNFTFLKKNINTINTFLQKYKTFNAAYQLKSDGSPTGDSLGINGGCLSVIDFLKKNAIDNENNDQIGDNNIIDNNAESSVEKRIPYLTTISPHAAVNNNDDPPKKYGHFSTLLYNELKKHNLYENSPRYLESQTFDDMEECDHHLAREMRKNNDTYENEYTLLKNIAGNNEQTTLFVSLGKIHTGSFIHKHGSACAYSMGGKRLWMLYNKTGMGLLNNKNLPKYIPHKCPRMDSKCIEGLHPIDMLQHYEELIDLNLEPYIHIQNDGDVFCFPEGWYHGTVNLDNVNLTLTVSFVLNQKEPFITSDYIWEGEDFDNEIINRNSADL